jgi:recombination protein RecA
MATKKAEKAEKAEKADKVLEAVQLDINKEYGEGSIMRLGGTATLDVEAISTGCLSLDMALGVGGVPKGRIVEVFGPESSGKTTLALHIVAECQKHGGKAAFIDAENALDPEYAKNLGCNADDLLVSQPDSGEQALDILQKLLETAALDVIVIDSVAALVPKQELDGQIGDVTVGLQARLMSQALRKLSGPINKSRTCVVFINQIREKIGVMFGSPETTPGGRALKFYSSVRLDIRRIAAIKEGTDMTGNRTRVKVVKNKVAPPFKMTEFDIMYGKGISYAGDLLDLALQGGVVEKMGSWFSYKGDKIAQGREKVKTLLETDDKLMKSVLSDVKDYLDLS